MAKPTPRMLDVIGSKYLTPHMCRVTLGGAGLTDFPADQESAYIKLIFPQGDEARARSPARGTQLTVRGAHDVSAISR